MRLFGREPALWIQALSATLALLVGLGLPGLNDTLAASITAVATAGAATWVALRTMPIAPTVFSGFITAAATLGAALGLDLSQQQVSLVTLTATAVMALLTRAQVTPKDDPSTRLVAYRGRRGLSDLPGGAVGVRGPRRAVARLLPRPRGSVRYV